MQQSELDMEKMQHDSNSSVGLLKYYWFLLLFKFAFLNFIYPHALLDQPTSFLPGPLVVNLWLFIISVLNWSLSEVMEGYASHHKVCLALMFYLGLFDCET